MIERQAASDLLSFTIKKFLRSSVFNRFAPSLHLGLRGVSMGERIPDREFVDESCLEARSKTVVDIHH